jgi:hypothetical protein
MSSAQDALLSAGIALEAGDDAPGLRAECLRLARLVLASGASSLGLAPAGDDVAVAGAAVKLARALAGARHQPVCLVDALGSWGLGAATRVETAGDGAAAPIWLLGDLGLITLRAPHPSLALHRLEACVARRRADHTTLVVDLTGFAQLGERRAAFELLDAAVVVARAGRTTTRQIRDALRDVPEDRGLGVLLTGVE